jgi:hypothetical protein
MILHVQYENDKYDYIGTHVLDKLLKKDRLMSFYRPSEERWVNVFRDPLRGEGGDYMGPNRRQLDVTK